MKNKNLKSIIIIFSMLLCLGVYAQGPPGGGGGRGGSQQGGGQQQRSKPDASEILSKLDLNNDEVIDKEEASKDERGKIAEDFDEIDTNADELIDLQELKDSLNNRKPKKISAKKVIKEVDDNGDGTLNELEVAAKQKKRLTKNFKTIDTNEDGELDIEELKVFYTNNEESSKRKKRD